LKVIAYEVREDEKEFFAKFSEEYGWEVKLVPDNLSPDNVELARGYDGVTVLGRSLVTAGIQDRLLAMGISCCATRTVGYDHMDVKHAREVGFKLCNANYPPTGVADYTIMLILMALRNYKQALWRGQVNDYSLRGLRGREMHDLTIGIVGTGRIGRKVIDNLTGFGCKILAYDVYQDSAVAGKAQYVDLATIYKECDVISLHTPLMESTMYMINRQSLELMKDGVVLINCARGELMDVKALIWGIESKKIGALALDVIEGESGIYHQDRRTDILQNKNMAYLRQFPNVVMTQHLAFYTDIAVINMVQCAFEGIKSFAAGQPCPTEV
jgi:lactate dehydrogenase-like 2-hydroxyacid dehydrogenase